MKDSELYAHRSDLNDAAVEKAEQRIRSRVDNTLQKIEQNIGLNHIDPSDAQRLRSASQQIKDGANYILPIIETLKSENHDRYRALLRGLDELTSGLVEAATRLAATASARNFFGKIKDHEKGSIIRKAKSEKNTDRNDAIVRAIVVSVQAQRVSGKWPSEWKLAEAIRGDVRRQLKGSGFKIGPTALYERVCQLFEINTLSRSDLVEPTQETRQASLSD